VSIIRERIGCWLHERWRAELVLRWPTLASLFGWSWLDLRNRREQLQSDALTQGRISAGDETIRQTVARIFPRVGGRLLQKCLEQWPVEFARTSLQSPQEPEVSIVIGVRGTGRLPQFSCCLEALAAQRGIRCEIIVVEQSWTREFESIVPGHVRYLHQQATSAKMPYNRSWALNAGVRAARSPIVILHDADMVVPRDFARAIAASLGRGLDAVRLPRFLFYLDQRTSLDVQEKKRFAVDLAVDNVVANNRTPVAVRRDAYLAIGGHDEGFFGWGAEDDEFMDRLRTLRIGEGAFLPIIHLWHPVAQKQDAHRNVQLLASRRDLPMPERIAELASRDWGSAVPSANEAMAFDRS
jgi:hypothetical protein